jgi:hypothetical protein
MRDFPGCAAAQRENAGGMRGAKQATTPRIVSKSPRPGVPTAFGHLSTCQKYVKGLFSIAAPE